MLLPDYHTLRWDDELVSFWESHVQKKPVVLSDKYGRVLFTSDVLRRATAVTGDN